MERETSDIGNKEVNQISFSEKENDQEELRLKDEHIADLQSQLDALLGTSGGGGSDINIDGEVVLLKKSVSSLLEKLRQVRRKHVDEFAALQKELSDLKHGLAFRPTYETEARKVLHERLESLALRVDELQVQLASATKANVIIVASEDDVQTLKDATMLRCVFEMKTDVLNRCMNDASLDKEQRETAEKSLHEHWVGQGYLITQLQMRLMRYETAHDALYKKLMKK